jgi:hypothetical protein
MADLFTSLVAISQVGDTGDKPVPGTTPQVKKTFSAGRRSFVGHQGPVGNVFDANTLALWRLDEASGAALDVGGLYNLAATGSPAAIIGQINGARAITAPGYFARSDAPGELLSQTTASNWTWEGWVKIDTAAVGLHAITLLTSGSYHPVFIGLASPSAHPGIPAASGSYISFGWSTNGPPSTLLIFAPGTTPLQLSTWYHIACVRDGTNLTAKLYVNGSLSDTFASNFWGYGYSYPMAPPSGPLSVTSGAAYLGGSALDPGGPSVSLDDVRLSKVARSGAEILVAYQNGRG